MAAALAYYTTFSLAPPLLIVISIAGFVFGRREAVQHEIQAQIQGLIGQGPASQVGWMIQNANQHRSSGVISAVLGIIALLFGATGAFSRLQSSLNQVWRVKPDPKAGGARRYRGAVRGHVQALAGCANPLAGCLDRRGNYRPAVHHRQVSDRVYLGNSGMAGVYGAAGSLILVVLWIYYSALIFLFGAEFTAVWPEEHSAIAPKPGAVGVSVKETVESGAPGARS